MRSLLIFENSRFVQTGLGITMNSGEPLEVVDLERATEAEFALLLNDPYNDELIDKIKLRE